MFDQTKGLFGRWLYYGLGTMFSLAVLSVMVTLATDMVIAVAASFWTSALLGAGPEGINSMALQQGGMGIVLSMLIMTAPPMAAMFFQGTLGSFSNYNQLQAPGGGQRYVAPPGAMGPGSPPAYFPATGDVGNDSARGRALTPASPIMVSRPHQTQSFAQGDVIKRPTA